MSNDKIYIPGLNGLRAIAALSVIACHLFYAHIGEEYLFDMSIAHYAVTMFFVISGFLITFLMLHEKQSINTISIKNFYFRRILRIWPIYFTYIFISTVILLITGKFEQLNNFSYLSILLVSGNFLTFFSTKGLGLFEHFWSIGVEEQFYLFWPLIVKYIKPIRKLSFAIIVLISVYISIKLIVYILLGWDSTIYIFIRQTRFDCMLIGAIGAVFYFQNNAVFLKILSNSTLQAISWLIYFLVGFNIVHIPVFIVHEVVAICTLIIIIGLIRNPLINLEIKLFEFLGKISYGLYVIHPLVLAIYSYYFIDIHINSNLKWFLYFILSVTTTILLAWVSYTFFESKFLRLKNKYAIVKSSTSSVQGTNIINH